MLLFSISAVCAEDGLNETRDSNIDYEMAVLDNNTDGQYNVELVTNDLTKIYKNNSQFEVRIEKNYTGIHYLSEPSKCTFEVNGVLYYRTIQNGTSKLNINLEPGNYVITTYYGIVKNTNTITVLPTIVENNDLTKFYKNDSQYTVKVLGPDGKAVSGGKNVTFNINGVFYTRQTNAEGIAKLNINLAPGNYIITAEYDGCKVSNKIIVRPTLMLFPQYSIGCGIISVRVLDGKGEGLANAPISININGEFYEFKTGKNGIFVADGLVIKLPTSDYRYTVYYNGDSVSGIWHLHGAVIDHDSAPWALEKIYS